MEDRDYKLLLQDMTNVYIGGRLSYDQIMNMDEAPHRLKSILDHTILKEVDRHTTISDHVFFIKEGDISYSVYHDMRARFLLNIPSYELDGIHYHSREYTIDDIVNNASMHEMMDVIFVEELHIGKLYLLGNYDKTKKNNKKRAVNMEDYIDEFLKERENEI